jgi:hypothetical protein
MFSILIFRFKTLQMQQKLLEINFTLLQAQERLRANNENVSELMFIPVAVILLLMFIITATTTKFHVLSAQFFLSSS